MSPNKLTIRISGSTATGKTTVAKALLPILRKLGKYVEFQDDAWGSVQKIGDPKTCSGVARVYTRHLSPKAARKTT